jgi:hypothetical protein
MSNQPRTVDGEPWKDAVIQALVVASSYRAEHDTNPPLAVADLIDVELQMAMNPRTSKEAKEMIERVIAFTFNQTIRAVDRRSTDGGDDGLRIDTTPEQIYERFLETL